MKRVLAVIGGIFLLLLVVGAAFFGWVAYQGRGLDASSKTYVDESVPAIVSGWSTDELLKRAHPELTKTATREQMERLMGKLSTLGKLERYEGSRGDSKIFVSPQGKTISAAYVANARFEKGPATISIRLLQKDGAWLIVYFYVSSPHFLQ